MLLVTLRVLRIPLVLVAVLVLQLTLVPELPILGVIADIMLLFALVSGLVAGAEGGAALAFVYGLAFDLNLQTPFGLSAFSYCLVTWAAMKLLRPSFDREVWWFASLVVFSASASAVAVYALVATVFGQEGLLRIRLLLMMIVVSAVNGLLTPLALRVQRWALRPVLEARSYRR